MDSKTVLITGGAGFLGSHLCDRFVNLGWNTIALDNLLTGSTDNIAHLFGHPRFQFIQYDVTKYLFFRQPIDLILHFACPASPVDYFQHPIHTMKVDSLGTLNTLGLAKAKRARYVFASTSEIYGSPQVHPQREDYWGHVNPVGVRAVYDEAKRFSESMTMTYHREHGIDVRIARIFNTYGTRMRLLDGRVIPTFIAKAIKGEAIPLYGEGSQTRSFCHVDDLVDGIAALSTLDELPHRIFNLGNPEEVTIKLLADRIIELTHSRAAVEFFPLPSDDPERRKPDIARARECLGFAPKIPISEGLTRIIPWFAERIDDRH